jgi:hypothetical protein|tara:strand:+ start:2824 stop:2967 length:144 start_codon:yes stop_codon:yes gene_type:complete
MKIYGRDCFSIIQDGEKHLRDGVIMTSNPSESMGKRFQNTMDSHFWD